MIIFIYLIFFHVSGSKRTKEFDKIHREQTWQEGNI